jgi:hypothetical protein
MKIGPMGLGDVGGKLAGNPLRDGFDCLGIAWGRFRISN